MVDLTYGVEALALIAEVSSSRALMRGSIFHLGQTCSASIQLARDFFHLNEALLDHLDSSTLVLDWYFKYQLPFFFFLVFWQPPLVHFFMIYLTEQ